MSDQIITRDIANWVPKTYNDEARSVRVVAVTENPVTIHDIFRDTQYSQITLLDGVHLPANRQVPLLDSHNWRSVSSVLGSARHFVVAGNALECDVFFSSTPMGIEVAQKVKEGHLTDFSVGFLPVESVWVPDGDSSVIRGRIFNGPTQIVTKWNLLELSVTAIGKDRNAKVRNWEGKAADAEMPENTPEADAAPSTDITQWHPLTETPEHPPEQPRTGYQDHPDESFHAKSAAEPAPAEISTQTDPCSEPDTPELNPSEIPDSEIQGKSNLSPVETGLPVFDDEKKDMFRTVLILIIMTLVMLASAMIK